jgi:hypothetical protein
MSLYLYGYVWFYPDTCCDTRIFDLWVKSETDKQKRAVGLLRPVAKHVPLGVKIAAAHPKF